MKPGRAFSICIYILTMAACDGGGGGPDANLQPLIDAPPPPPDAFSCNAPLIDCGMVCVNTTMDEQHCGGCNMPCQSGASCQTTCVCPPSFLPTVADMGFMEMVRDDFFPGAYVAIYPFIANEIDIAVVGYDQVGTQIGMPYTLTSTLGTTPFVAAGFNVDPATMSVQAAFYATSGTLTFTIACSTHAVGTLTNATFQAVADLMNPMVDPAGCSFTVPTFSFDIGVMCP